MAKIQIGKVFEIPIDPLPDALYLEKGVGESKFKLRATSPTGEVIELDTAGGGSIEFEFNTPAEIWIVTHNLNKKPDPLILVGGKKVGSDVEYIDNDVFKIIHSKPQTGVVSIIS